MAINTYRTKPFVPVVNRSKWSNNRYCYKRHLIKKYLATASYEKVKEYHLESWCAENNITVRPPAPDKPQPQTLDRWAQLSGKAAQDSLPSM